MNRLTRQSSPVLVTRAPRRVTCELISQTILIPASDIHFIARLQQKLHYTRYSDWATGSLTEESWFDSRHGQDISLHSECPDWVHSAVSILAGKEAGTSDLVCIYWQASDWVSLHFHSHMGLHGMHVDNFTFTGNNGVWKLLPRGPFCSCTKWLECSDSNSASSTHVGATYLKSATYTRQSVPVKPQ
jgi:hypothetical protein